MTLPQLVSESSVMASLLAMLSTHSGQANFNLSGSSRSAAGEIMVPMERTLYDAAIHRSAILQRVTARLPSGASSLQRFVGNVLAQNLFHFLKIDGHAHDIDALCFLLYPSIIVDDAYFRNLKLLLSPPCSIGGL
jgi:hypothetical protein